MPTFISKGGKWAPAKEKIGLTNMSDHSFKYQDKEVLPGEPFVYDGPDREALKLLEKEGQDHLGVDFRHDPEFRQSVRNQGFDNVEEYLKHIGYDEKEDEAKFKSRAAVVKSHEVPKRVNEIRVLGGGKDMSGNKENDVIGGFGDQRLTPANAK